MLLQHSTLSSFLPLVMLQLCEVWVLWLLQELESRVIYSGMAYVGSGWRSKVGWKIWWWGGFLLVWKNHEPHIGIWTCPSSHPCTSLEEMAASWNLPEGSSLFFSSFSPRELEGSWNLPGFSLFSSSFSPKEWEGLWNLLEGSSLFSKSFSSVCCPVFSAK